MKSTTVIRNKLGLSQQDMATYLSVKRSQLAMYEKGQRDLPTDALQKLGEIEIFLNRPHAKKKPLRAQIKSQQVKAKLVLEKHAKLQAYKQALALRKLATVQKAYTQKLLLLDLLDHLKGSKKKVAMHTHHSNWLSIMENGALKILEQNGLHIQAKLNIQIKKKK